jgi:hypothetical protein
VVFLNVSESLTVWSAASGGHAIGTLSPQERLERTVDVSRDGRYIAYVRRDAAMATPQTHHLVIDTPDLSAAKVGPPWTWMHFQFVGNRLIVAWSAADESSGLASFDPETGSSVDLAPSTKGPFILSPDEQRVAITTATGGGVMLVPVDGSGASVLLAPDSPLLADGGLSGFLADGSILYEQNVPDSYRHYINRVGVDGQPQRIEEPSGFGDVGAWVEAFSPDRRWFLFSQERFASCRGCRPDLYLANPDEPGVAAGVSSAATWFTSDSRHVILAWLTGFDCGHYACSSELVAAPVDDPASTISLSSPESRPFQPFNVLPVDGAQVVFSRFGPDSSEPRADLARVDLASADPPTKLAVGIRDFVLAPDRKSVVYLDDKGLYRIALPPAM